MRDSSLEIKNLVKRNQISFYATFFLLTYWWVGFDGITFSDDVFYILAGDSFWKGTMVVSNYHFSSRWGAYVPAGLIGALFGNDPHTISAISLISYIAAYFLLLRLTKESTALIQMSLWFCTPVYFLHFLTKVYPDSLLVFWTCLVPFAAYYRFQYPVKAGIFLVLGLFLGFLTKETIIFFAPLPILLFFFDRKASDFRLEFYTTILITGLLLSICYLGYFWISFGDPFYRISSINAGHYISEFTYADKGFWSIFGRLTILPFQTFVERAYWPWLVFALPGVALGWKNRASPAFIFSIALSCLLLGFWFMSSTLAFYNPIYLNPRHLIILIPILAFLIGSGWEKWQGSKFWELWITGLLVIGVVIAVGMQDWKMAFFNTLLIFPVFLRNHKIQLVFLIPILVIPAMYSIFYQQNLKQYNNLIETLRHELDDTDLKYPTYTHSFLDFSEKVILPEHPEAQTLLIPLYQFPVESDQFPTKLKVLIYDYYRHAYPEEQVDVDLISEWLEKNYHLTAEKKSGNLTVYEYELK
jgi:hypothetical protein